MFHQFVVFAVCTTGVDCRLLMRKSLPQPFETDIATCDLLLFGYLKDKLQGMTFTSQEDAISAVQHVLSEIPIEMI
jgi:hypothetical protein